jgi:hypothetical protein
MYSSSIPIVNCAKFWPIRPEITNNFKMIHNTFQKKCPPIWRAFI